MTKRKFDDNFEDNVEQFFKWIDQHYYLTFPQSKEHPYHFQFYMDLLYPNQSSFDWDKAAKALIEALFAKAASVPKVQKELQREIKGSHNKSSWEFPSDSKAALSLSAPKPINYCTMLFIIAREKRFVKLNEFLLSNMVSSLNWEAMIHYSDQNTRSSLGFLPVLLVESPNLWVNYFKKYISLFPLVVKEICPNTDSLELVGNRELILECKKAIEAVYQTMPIQFPLVLVNLTLDYIFEDIDQLTRRLNARLQKIDTQTRFFSLPGPIVRTPYLKPDYSNIGAFI